MIERLSDHTRQAVLIQTSDRRRWIEHDTIENIDEMIRHEGLEELPEAVELCLIGESAFALASEIGDVFYLATKRASINPEFSPEIIQILEYTQDIADTAGIDIDSAVKAKVFRNDVKYLHHLSNNGYDYHEGRELSRRQYELWGGDVAFSNIYLQLAGGHHE
ncbi:MAG: hypothetical protein WC871_02415 [Bacteroidales bacterium]|jgi:hypothetical protein